MSSEIPNENTPSVIPSENTNVTPSVTPSVTPNVVTNETIVKSGTDVTAPCSCMVVSEPEASSDEDREEDDKVPYAPTRRYHREKRERSLFARDTLCYFQYDEDDKGVFSEPFSVTSDPVVFCVMEGDKPLFYNRDKEQAVKNAVEYLKHYARKTLIGKKVRVDIDDNRVSLFSSGLFSITLFERTENILRIFPICQATL